MSIKSAVSNELVIKPRDRRFCRGETYERFWLANDPVATAFYNSLSITLPHGEAFFISSISEFRRNLPKKLAREVKVFISQEAAHGREHAALNRVLNYDVRRLEDQVAGAFGALRDKSPIIRLTVTMVLEHYTAILAAHFLTDQNIVRLPDVDQVALWRWHAREEIEHKGVAYDVWCHATRNWSAFRRWSTRSVVMTLVSINFWRNRNKAILWLLEQDGIVGIKARAKLLWYLFGRPGVQRKLILPLIAIYSPGFHPWNRDDRDLLFGIDGE